MFGNKKEVRELERKFNALCFHLGVEFRKVPATANFTPEHYKIMSFRETAKKAVEATHGILRCSKCQTLKPSYQFHLSRKSKTG